MKKSSVILGLLISFVIGAAMIQNAMAAGVDDPARLDYYKALKGKKMVFVPVAIGFLLDGWLGCYYEKPGNRRGNGVFDT